MPGRQRDGFVNGLLLVEIAVVTGVVRSVRADLPSADTLAAFADAVQPGAPLRNTPGAGLIK